MNIGKLGENESIKYLRKNGYKIIQRNFRQKCGEIDIIVRDSEYICFVEVKSRTSLDFADPFEFVDCFKQKKMITTAKIWLIKNKLPDQLCRFDVVSILFSQYNKLIKIEHIKNAFCEILP